MNHPHELKLLAFGSPLISEERIAEAADRQAC
jgi:hypothetical protein